MGVVRVLGITWVLDLPTPDRRIRALSPVSIFGEFLCFLDFSTLLLMISTPMHDDRGFFDMSGSPFAYGNDFGFSLVRLSAPKYHSIAGRFPMIESEHTGFFQN
jgi:hypothetical protein